MTTEQCDAVGRFVRMIAALSLAEVAGDEPADGDLTIPLTVSRWMRIAGVDVDGAIDTLLLLRDTLVDVSGLDRRSEPVPLLAGSPSTALLGLVVYVDALLGRAARRVGASRVALADRALRSMGS